ncbi:TVB79 protein, partial [Polyodon spathula]|nr:TVB79 protein [Polyodon spathula]
MLHCLHDAADHYYLYWYRQGRDGGLTLIAYSLNKDDEQYEAGFESSFTIHRPEVKRSSFEIKSVKSEDTAVYFCASSFSQGVTVTQTPEILLSSKRKNVTINCKHDQSSHYQIYWYRQARDRGLTFIGYSPGANRKELEKGFESKFDITRPDIYHSSLEIESLTFEDTAVYFCASSITLTQNCTTALQKLTLAAQLTQREGKWF